jgi:hypothetical protein
VQVNDDDNDDEDEPMAAEEVCIVIDIFHFEIVARAVAITSR